MYNTKKGLVATLVLAWPGPPWAELENHRCLVNYVLLKSHKSVQFCTWIGIFRRSSGV